MYGANKKFMAIPTEDESTPQYKRRDMYINIGHLTMKENFQRVRHKSAGER